jgi:type II secretory pathway component PulF
LRLQVWALRFSGFYPDKSLLVCEMSQESLQRVLAFNKELAALSAAGLRLDLGDSSEPVPQVLERANANLALRTGLGQSASDALAEDDQLPLVYRRAVLASLIADSPTVVLEGISGQPAARDELRSTVGNSFVQPLVLTVLAYLGFLLLCMNFSPSLEGIYAQWQRAPSASVSALQTARLWMPVWGPLAPVLFVGAIFIWRRGREKQVAWIPFAGRYAAALRHGAFANQLATLLEHGLPLAEGLRLAGGVSGNSSLQDASSALALAVERDKKLLSDDPQLITLPPLLRWAFTGDLGDQPLPDILKFVSDTYLQKAQRQAAAYRIAVPALIGALLGGSVVFVYALCVFLPYVQLFRDLSI